MGERLERPCVKALDVILGVPFKVLDAGFVRLVDYMGGDESIVQAARLVWERHEEGLRGPGTHPLPDAKLAHDAFRDVRDQAPCPGPDGLLAAVDTSPDGQC